jgi:hypothetical protein
MNKNRSKLSEFHSEACLGQIHAVYSVCWSRIFCKTNFLHAISSVSSLGIDSSVNLGMSFFFRGITEAVSSPFRGTFSEPNSVANSSLGPCRHKSCCGTPGWAYLVVVYQALSHGCHVSAPAGTGPVVELLVGLTLLYCAKHCRPWLPSLGTCRHRSCCGTPGRAYLVVLYQSLSHGCHVSAPAGTVLYQALSHRCHISAPTGTGPVGQYYSLSHTNASRPGGYAGGRPGENEYGKRNARPEGERTRDSPSSRAAGCKGEGCRKRRWTSSVAIGHSSVPPRVGRRYAIDSRLPVSVWKGG